MKIIEPSYEIWDCPDGEAVLAKIERIGRECYKSGDKIDDGREPCSNCSYDALGHCACSGTKMLQVREPSSHAFMRMILRADRRKDLISRGILELDPTRSCKLSCSTEADIELVVAKIVHMTLDNYRDDPPHDGLLEHASVTVHFTVNRSFTHELVRHRHGSYAQESTRYCNYSKGKFGKSITVIKRSFELEEQIETWMHAMGEIEGDYMKLISLGVKPEIARDLLSQATKASITLTANFNSLRNFFRKRCSPRAHPDMRALMIPFRDEMRKRIPIVFDELI